MDLKQKKSYYGNSENTFFLKLMCPEERFKCNYHRLLMINYTFFKYNVFNIYFKEIYQI